MDTVQDTTAIQNTAKKGNKCIVSLGNRALKIGRRFGLPIQFRALTAECVFSLVHLP